jgi:hypothetical protein
MDRLRNTDYKTISLVFLNYMGKIVRAGAGAGMFDELEP